MTGSRCVLIALDHMDVLVRARNRLIERGVDSDCIAYSTRPGVRYPGVCYIDDIGKFKDYISGCDALMLPGIYPMRHGFMEKYFSPGDIAAMGEVLAQEARSIPIVYAPPTDEYGDPLVCWQAPLEWGESILPPPASYIYPWVEPWPLVLGVEQALHRTIQPCRGEKPYRLTIEDLKMPAAVANTP